MLHALDPSTARTQIAHDGAGKIFRRDDFHRHDRLQNDRARLASSLFERHRAGDLESHFVRIHIVIAAVEERRFYIDHRIAGENAAFHGFLHTLIDRLDVLLGHGTTYDVVDELVAFTGLVGLQPDLGMTVLTAATRLADVLAFRFRMPANGLAIRHLRLADVGFHLVLALHAVHDNFQ